MRRPITELTDQEIMDEADAEVAHATHQRRVRSLILFYDWFGPDESPPTTPYEALMRAGPNEPEVSTMERIDPLEGDIKAVLDGLSDEDRSIVLMSFVEGLPARRVAELMNIPKSTVHDRLKRLRSRLAVELSQYRRA